MKLEIKDIAGRDAIKLAKITGDLDAINADSFRKAIVSNFEKGKINWIIDLQALRFIDSAGNLSLLNVYMKAKKEKGSIVLFGPVKNIREAMEVVGVNKLIPIYDTFDEALRNFNI